VDLGSVIGLAGTFFLLFVSISLSGSILQFVDIPSIMIVAGCSFATFLVSNPKRICLATIKYLMIACRSYKVNLLEIISIFVSFAEKARRDGLLALESDIDELKDDFLRRGLQMVVDGTDPNLIKSILEIDLAAMEDRHATAAQVFINIATLAPAFGMLGTLIGLIQMLASLDDPSAIGPAMAVALITTFYGSIIANCFCNPIAFKLRAYSAEEVALKELTIEGMLAIQSGDNPRIVEERLKAFLPPKEREVKKKREEE